MEEVGSKAELHISEIEKIMACLHDNENNGAGIKTLIR